MDFSLADTFSIDFETCVLPGLAECGARLTSLALDRFTVVDLAAVGLACPGLKHLALSHIGRYCPLIHTSHNMFSNLKDLSLR